MTTPVGDIRLDLSINGEGLSDDLLRAIRQSVLPMVAEMQKQLREIERAQQRAAREAERAGAREAAAAKTAEAAVEDLGDEHTKTAAKAAAASGMSTRAINAQTRALAKHMAQVLATAAAYDKLTASQTAAAAAPQPPPPPRGGSGGGGGGSPGGNHFSRGSSGSGGFFGFGGPMVGAAGWNAVAGIVGSFPAAATAVTNLTGAIQNLLQVGLVLPGVFATAGASIATAVLGFQGMGEAIEALNEAAASGDPKDLEKAAEAIKGLDANAVAVAKSVVAFTSGPLKDLQKATSGTMFEGVSTVIDDLANKSVPTLQRGTQQVASAWNGTFKELGRVLGDDSSQSFMDRIFGNSADAQNRANAAIEPLIHGFGTLAAEGSDFIPRLADGLDKLATRFDNWITAAAADGSLDTRIDNAFKAAADLGEALLNVGKIIDGLTEAAGGDGGFLQWLRDSTTALAALVNSTEGQDSLRNFFAEGREQIAQWRDILGNLGPVIQGVYQSMKAWADVLLPFLQTATELLSQMPGGIEAVTTAFLAFKTISPFTALLGGLSTVNTQLGDATTKAGGLRNAIKNIGAVGGLGVGVAALSDQQQNGVGINNTLLTTGGLAAAGFAMAGGPGAIVGAVAGLGVSIYNRIKADIDKGRAEWEAQWQANRADPQHQEWQRQVDNKVLAPILANPAAQTQLPTQVANGQYPGFSSGPGGSILGPDGKPLPIGIGQVGGSATQMIGIDVKVNDEQVDGAQEKVGVLADFIKNLPKGIVPVDVDPRPAELKIAEFRERLARQPLTVSVGANVPGTGAVNTAARRNSTGLGGRADGGVLPGYSPGVDNMLVPMSGGEGVIIPEAMRALGAGWLYNLNSRFRPGLSRRGYADGGVVGADGALPVSDLAGALQPVVELLSQILAALGGNNSGDLATQIGGETATALNAASTTGLTSTEQDIAKELAAGKLDLRMPWERAADDRAIAAERLAMQQQGSPGAPGVADLGRYAAALAAFARSGDLADVTGLGLNANDSVIGALTSARNKKKNGLEDDEIAALVEQIVGGSGYTGVLDERNSSLIKSLTRYNDQLLKGKGGGGYAPVAASTGVPMTPVAGVTMDPLSAFAQSASGGKYEWGASDLAAGLSDCSGAVSDLVEIITKAQADSGRLFSTDNAAEVLKSLGAVDGAVPGMLQIGWSNTHMRSTLPNGVAFESGGQTGQGATYGGNARGAEGMPNIMSLPAGGVLPGVGGANPLGYSGGGPVPVYIVGGPGGGPGDAAAGGSQQFLADALTGAVNAVLPQVMTDALNGVFGVGNRALPKETADALKLINERNPMAIAAALGAEVGDYNRTGSMGQADNLTVNEGPAFNARGQMYSDTAALIDRSFTSMWAKMDAEFQQIQDVLAQVRDQLVEISSQLAQAAAAAATQSAGSAASGMAYGGSVTGGIPGRDSVPALLMPGEHVLTTADVAAMGGQAGVYAFRRALAGGQVQGFATGGGVNVNDVVGAEFFGVSQIPIIGVIVNVLIRVLLAVLGVQIEARDTLNEMTDEFRQFRGDFEAFDASGRLINDTSALSERSQSSEELATQERVRILKIVIEALIKYIIEKVIVPMAKAVANSLLNFAGNAVNNAMSVGSFGMGGQLLGGLVQSLITGVGGAGVDVIAEIGTAIATNLTSVLIDVLGDGLLGLFPDLMKAIFSGGLLEQLIIGPLNALLAPVLGLFGGLSGGIGSLFAPLIGLLGGIASFDEGGIASGMGLMPKATIRPERVLSPQQTESFDRLVDAIAGGRTGSGPSRVIQGDVHFHISGSDASPEQIGSSLMELMS